MLDKSTTETISLRNSHRRTIRAIQRRFHLNSKSAAIQFIIEHAETGLPLSTPTPTGVNTSEVQQEQTA